MGKIKKCKLSWKPSESTLNVDDLYVDYRLYWSNVTPIGYNSNFIKLGDITEVDLPEILENYDSSEKPIYIGISAVDKWGNESDIITLSEPYKLSPPAAPVDLALTTFDDFIITAPREKAENQDTDTPKQTIEKTDQEIQSKDGYTESKSITDVIDGIFSGDS